MLTRFQHDRFGECELVRIEGVDWIVRSCGSDQLYRVPLSRRHDFVPIDASRPTSSETLEPTLDCDDRRDASSVTHKDAEGTNQLLRSLRNGNRPGEALLRAPVKGLSPQPRIADAKSESPFHTDAPLNADAHRVPPLANDRSLVQANSLETETPAKANPVITEPISVSVTDEAQRQDKRRLRRVFESLRNGLSPIHVDSRPFAVGIEDVQQKATALLADVATEGGRAVVLRGAYGQGKTFCLQLLKQIALESGCVVASTEIDAFENQIDKPHFIYRSLMQSLSFPDGGLAGPRGLVLRTRDELLRQIDSGHNEYRMATEASRLLNQVVQCRSLAWLLSGLTFRDKTELIGLLGCEPGVSVSSARSVHILGGHPRNWPAFSAGTQGDFGSYVLSGVGRLSRFLGYRGLILILDEMEKWQDLDWNAQCRAGNLLGGLIWAASAEKGNRQCKNFQRCAHTRSLSHSGRCGGFPFSTEDRCYLGIAIAMTPRGDTGPEHQWSEYGLLEIADLPYFTPSLLESYMQKVFPSYCRAYDMPVVMPSGLIGNAVKGWGQRGDGSTRSAVQAVMSALDDWRESLLPREA